MKLRSKGASSGWCGRIIKLVVSLVLIAIVAASVGPKYLVPEFFDWRYAVAAAFVFFVSNLLGAFQWNLLLRGASIGLPMWTMLRAYFVALFFNNFLIGNVGGDVIRAFDVRKNMDPAREGRTEAGVSTIVMDRFLGFFTMLWFAALGASVAHGHTRVTMMVLALLIGFTVTGVLITSSRIGALADRLVMRFLPDRLASVVVNLRSGFAAMRRRKGLLISAAIVSVGVQALRILVHYLCGMSVGVDERLLALGLERTEQIAYFFTFIPLVSIVAAVPVSFGGLGTREAAAVGLFKTVAYTASRAAVEPLYGAVTTMEILAHVTALASSLPGAFAFAFNGPKAVVEGVSDAPAQATSVDARDVDRRDPEEP